MNFIDFLGDERVKDKIDKNVIESLNNLYKNKFKNDKYLFYPYLLKILKIENDILEDIEKRIENFFLLKYKKLIGINNIKNKLDFLLKAEKRTNQFLVGTRWEMYNVEKIYDENVQQLKEKILNIVEEKNKQIREYEKTILQQQTSFKKKKDFEITTLSWKSQFNYPFSEIEVEIRFQNISGRQFGRVFDYFLSNCNYQIQNYLSTVVVEDNVRYYLFPDTKIFQRKKVINQYWDPEIPFKVVSSKEEFISSTNFDKYKSITRKKNIFKIVTNTEIFKDWYIFLSLVEESSIEKTKIKYDIELERKIFKPSNTEECIKYIFNLMYNGQVPVTKTERIFVQDIIKKVFNSKRFVQITSIIKKVLPFTTGSIRDFVTKNFYISAKLDGIRYLLIGYKNEGFLYGLDEEILKFDYKGNEITILDCEVKDKIPYIFDILFLKGTDFREKQFSERNKFLTNSTSLFPGSRIKNWSIIRNSEDVYSIIKNTVQESGYDGIILQEDNTYQLSLVLKWKPLYQNTIDIGLGFSKTNNTSSISFDSSGIVTNDFILKGIVPYFRKINLSNMVIECFFHPNKKYICPYRIRFDKRYPNRPDVISSTKTLIQSPIKASYFQGKTIFFSRKISNFIKRDLLNIEDFNQTLLDIGSGQGGDIDKWDKFSKVYAFEPDFVKIQEFKRRLRNNRKIILIEDFFNEKTVELVKDNIDIVTAFFSTNYVFENERSLSNFVKALAKIPFEKQITLYLIFPDGDRLIKNINLLNQSGNVTIKIKDENKISTKIPGTWVETDEYLFDFKIFISLMKEQNFGLELFEIPSFKNLSQTDRLWLDSLRILKMKKPSIIFSEAISEEYIEKNNDEEEDKEVSISESNLYLDVDQDVDFDQEVDEIDQEHDSELENQQIDEISENSDVIIEEEYYVNQIYRYDPNMNYTTFSNNDCKLTNIESLLTNHNMIFDRGSKRLSIYLPLFEFFTFKRDIHDIHTDLTSGYFGFNNHLEISLKFDGHSHEFFSEYGTQEKAKWFLTNKPRIDRINQIWVVEKFPSLEILTYFNFSLFLPSSCGYIFLLEDIRDKEKNTDNIYNFITSLKRNSFDIPKIFYKPFEDTVWSKLVIPIQWEDNSCYADVILMIMTASNMFRIYYRQIKNLKTADKDQFLSIFKQVKGLEKGENKSIHFIKIYLQHIKSTLGSCQDSGEFYSFLCDKFKLEFMISTIRTCMIMHDDINITDLKSDFFVVYAKPTLEYNDLVKHPIGISNKIIYPDYIPRIKINDYDIQAFVMFRPNHYWCIFKNQNIWIQYDGLSNMKIVNDIEQILKNEIIILSFYKIIKQ